MHFTEVYLLVDYTLYEFCWCVKGMVKKKENFTERNISKYILYF